MATVEFGNVAADMRLLDDYGIPALHDFNAFLESFVPVGDPVFLEETETRIVLRFYDAGGNFFDFYIEGNLAYGIVTAFWIEAVGVKEAIYGSFNIDEWGNIWGTTTEVRATWVPDGSVLAGVSGLSIWINFTAGSEPDIPGDDVILAGADTIYGGSGDDYLLGYAGNDVMNGGMGDDTLVGGQGNDHYVINDTGDSIIENAPEGLDRVESSVSYVLSANVERLTLTGNADISGAGDSLGNVIFGNSGSNIIDGGAGADLMYGGAGDDVYLVDNIYDGVFETQPLSIVRASTSSAGDEAWSSSFVPTISSNGRYVAFQTLAENLAGNDAMVPDVVVKDLQTGQTVNCGPQLPAGCRAPDISADGRYVVFQFDGSLSSPPSIYVTDLLTGTRTPISSTAQGYSPSISDDGRYVAFNSAASDLVAGDTNGSIDVFVKDLVTGAVSAASSTTDGTLGDAGSLNATLTDAGRYVVFESDATNLVVDDTNDRRDVFMKDSQTGVLTRVSTAIDGTQGNGDSANADVSPDGRYVVFDSRAANLVPDDTEFGYDVFVKDLQTGTVTLASTRADGTNGSGSCEKPTISADGRFVTFESSDSTLVPGDTNNSTDVFVKDLMTGALARVSIGTYASEMSFSAGFDAEISDDGRYIVFLSYDRALVPDDSNHSSDVFVAMNPLPLPDTGGTDTVNASVSYTLPDFVENLILTGSANIDGTGNALSNTLCGNAGSNTLSGGAGDDILVATDADGDDVMTGGPGFDVLDFSVVNGPVQVNQLAGTTTGSAGNDTLLDVIEQIVGTNFDDVLSGGHGINVLDGNGGNDLFFGNNGDDLMRGGDGDDTFFFSNSDGDDRLLGGAGFDILDYSSLDGVVQVNQLAGTTTGTAGNDTLLDVFEMVIGTPFGDVLSGGHGINSLKGGGGDDQIFANNGDDYVSGGAGDDRITFGPGDDTLDFRNGEGVDTITDFEPGAGSEDTLTLKFYTGLGATTFAEFEAQPGRISQVGADTQITLEGGDMIILENVVATSLAEADFVFA